MLAAIDLGTNTVRLLLGTCAGGKVDPTRYLRRITRLGGDFTPAAGLSPLAMERTLQALRDFAEAIDAAGATAVRGVGTAVLRRAGNGPAFVERVRAETGLGIDIIPGEEEAELSAAGVLSALEPQASCCLIFDIGGGSTEFTLVEAGQVRFHGSYPLGVIVLCEEDREPLRQQLRIEETLRDLHRDLVMAGLWERATGQDCRLVGTAGTVTTLAALSLGMSDYDWRRVNNLTLEIGEIAAWHQTLSELEVGAREALPGMEAGRGDLILPGTAVVLSLLGATGKSELTVSDFGLVEGVLLSLDPGNCR